MKHLKTYESYYRELDKITLNSPCTIFVKSKKHIRDVKITKDENEYIEWINEKNKTGKVDKSEIEDISYQND